LGAHEDISCRSEWNTTLFSHNKWSAVLKVKTLPKRALISQESKI
jgi:hypothetical protein